MIRKIHPCTHSHTGYAYLHDNGQCSCEPAPTPDELVAMLDRLLDIVARVEDNDLADRIATACHDPHHDDRACPTCSARADGIEAFQQAVMGDSDKLADREAAPSADRPPGAS